MNILQRLLGGEKPDVTEARIQRTKDNPTANFVRQVWDAPALFNRATRRRVRLFGYIWKWDANTPGMQRTYVPRYIRRHFTMDRAVTRRQRRHRAVILRIARAKGIG